MTKLLYSDTKITLIKFLKKICDVILYLACWGERVGSRTLANIFKKMIMNQNKITPRIQHINKIHIVICMRVGTGVCMCMIVGASLTPACYVGQVSVCIQLLYHQTQKNMVLCETDSEKRNYKWNYLYGLSLQSTINWTVWKHNNCLKEVGHAAISPLKYMQLFWR